MRLMVTILLVIAFGFAAAATLRGLGSDAGGLWLLGTLILGVAAIVAMLWWMAAALRTTAFRPHEQHPQRVYAGSNRVIPRSPGE